MLGNKPYHPSNFLGQSCRFFDISVPGSPAADENMARSRSLMLFHMMQTIAPDACK